MIGWYNSLATDESIFPEGITLLRGTLKIKLKFYITIAIWFLSGVSESFEKRSKRKH